jgi:hypothetical protein
MSGWDIYKVFVIICAGLNSIIALIQGDITETIGWFIACEAMFLVYGYEKGWDR